MGIKRVGGCVLIGLASLLIGVAPVGAQNAGRVAKAPAYPKEVPAPTLSEVRYGSHERHVMDFWRAESDEPTPLVFVIHGGGWKGGSKERVQTFVDVGGDQLPLHDERRG
ncbi:MAG: hypothetical protein ACYTGQ_19740 [Planctomycetota bacterium]|jgi:acetyl esterase/lipase